MLTAEVTIEFGWRDQSWNWRLDPCLLLFYPVERLLLFYPTELVILSFETSNYFFFLFWTLIAELVIDSISVLARTCPRLAGEDWPHGREYCWRHNPALNARERSYEKFIFRFISYFVKLASYLWSKLHILNNRAMFVYPRDSRFARWNYRWTVL